MQTNDNWGSGFLFDGAEGDARLLAEIAAIRREQKDKLTPEQRDGLLGKMNAIH